jgi:hypothetical protein
MSAKTAKAIEALAYCEHAGEQLDRVVAAFVYLDGDDTGDVAAFREQFRKAAYGVRQALSVIADQIVHAESLDDIRPAKENA